MKQKNENQFSRSKVESEEQVCFWTLARKERDLKSKTATKPVGGARIAAIDRDRIEKPPIQKPKHRARRETVFFAFVCYTEHSTLLREREDTRRTVGQLDLS